MMAPAPVERAFASTPTSVSVGSTVGSHACIPTLTSVPEHLEGGAEPKLSGIVFYSIFSHPQVVSVYSLILPG